MFLQQEQCITSLKGELVNALKRCNNLETGMKLHKRATKVELHTNKYVASALIRMYSRCQKMSLAEQLFNEPFVQRDVVTWNALILGFVENGESLEAFNVLAAMECEPDSVTYVAALKACGNLAADECGYKRELYLHRGVSIHKAVKELGLDSNMKVANTLIVMYGKCGRMELARDVFNGMNSRDTVTWTSLVLGYVKNGECLVAMDVFQSMDCAPDCFTYAAVIQACVGMLNQNDFEKYFCLEKGAGIHKRMRSPHSDLVVANTLIVMYSKLGSMDSAKTVFNLISRRDVVTWNSLLFGYVENKKCSVALDLFDLMDCEPTSLTYVAVIKACAGLVEEEKLEKEFCLEQGACLHKQLQRHKFASETVVATTLLDMYSKCGGLILAKEVFDGMTSRSVVTWSSLILGYVGNGESSAALELFDSMDSQPSSVTYIAALKACRLLASRKESEKHLALEKGMKIHKGIAESGMESELAVASALLDMYSKCRTMELARGVFDRMKHRDVVAWNSLMLGYVENSQGLVAVELFSSMDCKPSIVTYVIVLKAHAASGKAHLENVISLHKQIQNDRLDCDIRLVNTLIDTYGKCRDMICAKKVFDTMFHRDVISWTSLIMGYVENNQSWLAVELFVNMDCEPSAVTYITLLTAYRALAGDGSLEKSFLLEKGVAAHKQAKDRGFDADVVLKNTLIDMYCHCAGLPHAKEVFSGMPSKDIVTYNALIHGCVVNGESLLAVELFTGMGCRPNSITYIAVLKACSSLDALLVGQQVHAKVCELGMEQEHIVANALIDFYVKCGNMKKAEVLFHQMHSPDIVTWNILIAGYSSLGELFQVFARTKMMVEAGVPSDGVTLTCIMTACGQTGLVDKARQFLDSVVEDGVSLNMKHYNCIVDMLGRANRLEEAISFIKDMPFEGDSVTWISLLGACHKWNNMEVGKYAFSALVN